MFQTEWSRGGWGGVGAREEEKREGAREVPGTKDQEVVASKKHHIIGRD